MSFSLTLILIAITVVVSLIGFRNPDLTHRWMLSPYRMKQLGQYHQLLTSGFLHADLGHLAFNMLSLFFFGPVVEYYFTARFGETTGALLFLLLYLGGIIISDVPSYRKHLHNPNFHALGASGGVAGVIFSSILFNPLNEICLFGILCLPGFVMGALYLIYSVVQGKRGQDNINHDAHIYGALFGVALTLLLVPESFGSFVEQLLSYQLF